MKKSDILKAIKNDKKIYKNKKLRDFILSIEDIDKLQLCYLLFISTDYDIEQVSTILEIKNRSNINYLMDLLTKKVMVENIAYLKKELSIPKAQQANILKGYDKLLNDERFNTDYEFLSGVLKASNIQKVLKMIEKPEFSYYEDAFRNIFSNENTIISKPKTKFICAGELEKIEQDLKFEYGIRAKEFKEKEKDKRLTNEEFDWFLKKCMEDTTYREIYKIMYILVSFDPFKKIGKKIKDDAKILSKKYDLSESHGKKRYNAFIKQMQKKEKTRKKLD